METHAQVGRIHLQVESGDLDRFLFIAGQACGLFGEGVDDVEVHARTQSTKRLNMHTPFLAQLAK